MKLPSCFFPVIVGVNLIGFGFGVGFLLGERRSAYWRDEATDFAALAKQAIEQRDSVLAEYANLLRSINTAKTNDFRPATK